MRYMYVYLVYIMFKQVPVTLLLISMFYFISYYISKYRLPYSNL